MDLISFIIVFAISITWVFTGAAYAITSYKFADVPYIQGTVSGTVCALTGIYGLYWLQQQTIAGI